MLETPAAKAGSVLLIGALYSASMYGISIFNMMIGMAFAIVGVVGRGMVDMQKALEKDGTVKLSTTFGWMGAGIAGSPFVTIIYLAFLQGIHYPVDAFTAIVLMLFGYAGPRGVTNLVAFVSRFIPTRVNPNAAPNGGKSDGNT